MLRLEIEVLSDATNAWVVRTPGRQHAGIVIQGDSLQQLRDLARSICQRVSKADDVEVRELSEELLELLDERVDHYRRVVEACDLSGA